MINNRSLISLFFCIWLYSLSGCSSKQNTFNNIDSKEVDSLIRVQKINSRTLLVNFGYDAIAAIETDQGIVIVDAGISTGLTTKYKKLIENVFHKDDFIYVINTHGHHDHIGGNTVFSQARVVGHDNFSIDVSERWTDPFKSMNGLSNIIDAYEQQLQQSIPNTAEWYDIFTQKIRYLSAYSDVKNRVPARLPDITFSDSMTLELGDTKFEMFYFGKSHSNSDIVIYIPELKLIFIGDLFSKFGRPSINLSTIDKIKWMQAIVWIQKRENRIEEVIEGHGQILSIDDLKQFNNNILSRYSGPNLN
ncbi:MAG: MBL fold metallo-hydrolase [Bacteroidales bacterium]|nr:MBL fold metallo-hydrolase [Bacteroidales bacterium]